MKYWMRGLVRLCLAFTVMIGITFPGPVTAQTGAVPGDQNHMLWKISKNGNTEGYLVGSIHFMKADAYPLHDPFGEAFEASDVIAFEANIDSLQSQAQQLIGRLGMYPGDKSLRSELSDSTYSLLESRAESLGLNLTQMRKLEPWVLSIIIPATQMQRAGYSGQSGVDSHFFRRAKDAGKKRVAFETPAEQLGFFDRFPANRQEAYLTFSLRDAEQNVEMIDQMAAAWISGDADRLEDLVQSEMKSEFPDLYQTLIVERNQAWMPQIKTLLAAESQPFIVVGAGHVTGAHGLVSMLREDGYTVEQQ